MNLDADEEVTRGWLNEEAPATVTNPEIPDSNFMRKVYVNIGKKPIREAELKEYFSNMAPVEFVKINRDSSGKSLGYGFVTFTDEHSTDRVLSMKPHVIKGQQVSVRRAFPRDFNVSPKLSRNKLFIGGIPRSISKDDLESFFKNRYGTTPLYGIDSISLPLDALGKNKGFAFVSFVNEDLVDKIMFEMPRTEIGSQMCEIKRALLREENVETSASPTRFDIFTNENLVPQQLCSTLSKSTVPPQSESDFTNFRQKQTKNYFNLNDLLCMPGSVDSKSVSQPATKRKLKVMSKAEASSSSNNDLLDIESLAHIGRLFIETVSQSLKDCSSERFESSIRSLCTTTLMKLAQQKKS